MSIPNLSRPITLLAFGAFMMTVSSCRLLKSSKGDTESSEEIVGHAAGGGLPAGVEPLPARGLKVADPDSTNATVLTRDQAIVAGPGQAGAEQIASLEAPFSPNAGEGGPDSLLPTPSDIPATEGSLAANPTDASGAGFGSAEVTSDRPLVEGESRVATAVANGGSPQLPSDFRPSATMMARLHASEPTSVQSPPAPSTPSLGVLPPPPQPVVAHVAPPAAAPMSAPVMPPSAPIAPSGVMPLDAAPVSPQTAAQAGLAAAALAVPPAPAAAPVSVTPSVSPASTAMTSEHEHLDAPMAAQAQ